MQLAGAGAGVYNATRQVGAVLGSAAIAVLMDARLAAKGLDSAHRGRGRPAAPPAGRARRSARRCDAMLLPAAVLVLGLVAVLFFERPRHPAPRARTRSAVRPAAERA